MRYVTPDERGLHQRFVIAGIRRENYRTVTLTMDDPLPAAPGQFVMAWLPGIDERPFSVAGDDPLTLTIAEVGPFSGALHRLLPGDPLWIRGPLGRGYSLLGRRILLAGGGYGVAPLLFLARRAQAAEIQVMACIGARTAQDVLLVEQLRAAGAQVHVATEDGSLGRRGLITAAIGEAILAQRPDCVYSCGPVRMLEAIDVLCETSGLPRQLSWEAHMRCGIGLCGSCELHDVHASGIQSGWLTCLDGPVSFGGEIR
jgi:dihydroorotate dehydrogenase electron transfer subunit